MRRLVLASRRYPPIRAECDHVSAAPEVRRRIVFRSGISHGLITSIPLGGHTAPICGVGLRLAWKYAQKKAKKSLTSDTIKRTLPKRSPF